MFDLITTKNSDRLFDLFLEDFYPIKKRALDSNWIKINVKEVENRYEVEASVPGIKKENINLEVKNNKILELSVNLMEDKTVKDTYLSREFGYEASYKRTIFLSKGVNEASIKAKLVDGILYITLEKITPEVRKIDIT